MNDRIAYDSDRERWYLLRTGSPVASSVNREILERKYPDATVEEPDA